ncbi:MAG: hypothetical protein AAB459_04450 [Patescibacteria group bacterium]
MRTLQEIVLEQPGTPEAREHLNHVHEVGSVVDDFLHRLDAELGGLAASSEVEPTLNCSRITQRPRRNSHIDAILGLDQ